MSEVGGDPPIRNAKDGTRLVRIPASTFLAGGPGKDEGDGPFAVSLPAYCLAVDPVSFRIKAYAGGFFFFWFTFNTATYLSCYFAKLQAQADKEQAEKDAEDAADS